MPREAEVVVEGASSNELPLNDQLFQGTTWGCRLWNVYYADASRPVTNTGHVPIKFADDLNSYKIYTANVDTQTMLDGLNQCRNEVYQWGRANKLTFSPSKE